jgi:uncharacterized membrane protein YoaK (UPF0700 family)
MLIVLGAVTGAVLCQAHEGLAVVAAACVVLAVTALGHARARADGPAAAATPGSTTTVSTALTRQ